MSAHLTQRIRQMFQAHRAQRAKPAYPKFPSREWLLAYQRLLEMQRQAMTTWPFDPNLKAWGATYAPATVAPGQEYWRLVQADGPMDIGGNHHIYVDVWNKDGDRMVGVPVELYWHDGTEQFVSEPKPGEPAALSIPMYAGGNAYGVHVIDGRPSDKIFGFGLGSFVPHHSFRAIFRLSVAAEQPPPPEPIPVPPPPEKPITQREYLEWAEFYIAKAKEMAP